MTASWILPVIPIIGALGILLALKFFPIPRDTKDTRPEYSPDRPGHDADGRFRHVSR